MKYNGLIIGLGTLGMLLAGNVSFAQTPYIYDYFDDTVSFEYPRSGTYTSNPLFIDFTSPMMGSNQTGPLYTADPSAHVWNIDGKEVLYLYASHDMEPPRGCDYMDRYHIFSTEDLVHWTDHGEVMNAATSNAANGYGSDGFMWAPDCGYNPADKLYYFIYPHKISNDVDKWNIFVATSPNPAGPFTCRGHIEGVPSIIDPCLFVDDDGQPYIYVGGGGHCWGGRLKKDNWLELDGPMQEMSGFTDFHEGPWIHKYNGKYYLSHPDNNWNNNHLQYSIGDTPLGPWKPMGMYMRAHGHDTTHGSIVKFKDKWYQFYHTADYGCRGNLRSVCFDELKYNPDGSIQIINTWGEPFNGQPIEVADRGVTVIPVGKYNVGPNSKAYFTRDRNAPSREAEYTTLLNEEWLRYQIDVPKKGKYRVSVDLRASSDKEKKLSLLSNVEYLTDHNGVKIPTECLDKWGRMVFEVPLEEGEQTFELRVKKGPVDINYFTLQRINEDNVAERVSSKYDSYNGLVMAGYQGWFSAEGDGENRGYYHYEGRNGFRPGSATVDFWPYNEDYACTYPTDFRMDDGSPARVFSSADPSTVDTHFRWMKEYGLDGVFIQRFVAEINRVGGRKHFDGVLANAMRSANDHDRAIAIMYDLSGMHSGDVQSVLSDAKWLADTYNLFEHGKNPSYLYHNGKPLVAVWGVGFDDGRKYNTEDCDAIISALKDMGFSVMIGVPTYWREQKIDTESGPRLHEVIKKCDILMPWFVGRYNPQSFGKFKNLVADDAAWCKEAGVGYVPLVFPGFSWRNMHNGKTTPIPRQKGKFLQMQIDNALKKGCRSLYVAMFDEIDEGTAVFKCATDVPLSENGTEFVPIEKGLNPDHYLKIVGSAANRLKKK